MIAVDIIVAVIIAAGAYAGWKRGFLTSLLDLVGSIIVFVLAYMLKGPISLILIDNFPFLKFDGVFAGITSLNVMIYECIAFIIASIVVSILFKLLLKLTGLFNKVFNSNIITGLPNKILGLILGAVKNYVTAFLILFIASLIPQSSSYITDSFTGPLILNNTPVLTGLTKDFTKTMNEINDVFKKIDIESENQEINGEILDIMLKYEIITKETAISLHEAGKLEIDNFDEIISKY